MGLVPTRSGTSRIVWPSTSIVRCPAYVRAWASNSSVVWATAKAFESSRLSRAIVAAPASCTSQSPARGSAIATHSRSNRRAIERASIAIASRLSVMTCTSRLRSKRRASSSRRDNASRVPSRAAADSLLATRLTARNANRATQLCGSAMVSAPVGGRKKKLKQNIATTDVTTATHSRDVVAIRRTMSRKVVDTVAAFDTCNHPTKMSVTPATAATPTAKRATSPDPRDMMHHHSATAQRRRLVSASA